MPRRLLSRRFDSPPAALNYTSQLREFLLRLDAAALRIFTDFKIPISAWSAIIALFTAVLVGVIFGTLPANRAAKLDPVVTLKYE